MVDIIRRKNAQVQAEDVSAVGKATVGMINSIGSAVADAGSAIESAYEKHQKQKLKEQKYQEQVQENIYKAQEKIRADEQKAFDASDKIVAADMAGRLKNDLLRWNMEQRQNNPNFIGTAEHEKRMRDEYTRLANKYGAGLGEAGRSEFTNRTQNAVNEFISNDVKWAYQQKLKKGEESAKQIAETMNQNAKLYGANGDVEGFKQAHEEDRQALKDYVGDIAPNGAKPALYETDKNSMIDFLMGMAETDPEKARAIMDNPELFKQIVPEDMLQNVNDIMRDTKTRDLNDKLTLVNFDLARGVDKKQKKKLEKLKKNTEKDLKNVEKEDFTDSSLASIKDEIGQSVNKTIDYNLNLLKEEQKKQQNQQKIENSLAFMDNPILYRANLNRAFGESSYSNISQEADDKIGFNKQLDEKASEIYSLSDKVGDGKVDPATLQLIVRQVASITADDKTGIVDDNIMKAYDADIALRKAGASPEQLQTYHRLAQIAMTDTNFKQSVAALANKPDFNTMFLDKRARYTGLRSLFRTAKDDDTDYVEDLGRQAYMGAMNYMIQGRPEDALRYYDSKVQEAYDYIKKDVIDVDYVKRELAKTGSAMVELNGRMTKITGRLPNGEYIVESTGEKVNGNF
jgi:hypothetical protein